MKEQLKYYIKAENEACEKLKLLGYNPQGVTSDLKHIAIIDNGLVKLYQDYQTALNCIQ